LSSRVVAVVENDMREVAVLADSAQGLVFLLPQARITQLP
jgi:hypothetical protein